MKKKIYWVRMEAVGYTDFKVLAHNKKEAEKLADRYKYLATCNCDGFESGEVSTKPLSAFDSKNYPTEEEPVIEI